MKPEECEPLALDWRLPPERMEQLIKGRRSVRNYRTERVEPATLAKLIEIARYAPTGMNSQSVHWKVVHDEQEVQWLSLAVVEWLRSLQGDGVHGAKGLIRAWEAGRDPILRKAPHLIIAHGAVDDPMASYSSTIALATLELTALSFGLGACWAGFLHQAANSSADVATALNLPPGHRMYGGLMIGYPEFEYSRIPVRKPAPVIWE
jgi:nitroreductase